LEEEAFVKKQKLMSHIAQFCHKDLNFLRKYTIPNLKLNVDKISEVAQIPESGGKIRCVTKSHSSVVLLGHGWASRVKKI